MNKKFIPNGDMDFAMMAESFSRNIAKDPRAYHVSDDDVAALETAVKHFRQALNAARTGGARSPVATAVKEEARRSAEKIVRRLANGIRSNDAISSAQKLAVGFRVRNDKPKQLTVPNEPPRLTFVQAVHHANAIPEHELKFWSLDYKPRPEGAVRLELFVSLMPPETDVLSLQVRDDLLLPTYLRSYTKSPITVRPPMASKPMRVIYWARWADAQGNVGPMCQPIAGWIEGGSHHLMGLTPRGFKRAELQEMSDADEAAREHHTTVVVALVQAQRSLMHQHSPVDALPEPVKREIPQLEAPAEAA